MPGVAELPLHDGRVPPWMLKLMERMASAIVESIVELKGPKALIQGLADPVWFQAFNNVIGMDWDSSGSTTVLLGVLKSVTWKKPHLGILVLGGKGRRMLEVPSEAEEASRLLGVDAADLVIVSKLAARLDSAFIQDGYQLYHHSLVVSSDGDIVVIQQGMNLNNLMARRYHLDRFDSVEEAHSGIAGVKGEALNAADRDSKEARRLFIDILSEGPSRFKRLLYEAIRVVKGQRDLLSALRGGAGSEGKDWAMRVKYYKPLPAPERLVRAVKALAENPPKNDRELLIAPHLGPSLVRALALIADVIYSVPTSTRDPVTHPLNPFIYAYAVGGKDGVPYPYNPKVARKVIEFLEDAINEARLGNKEKLRALERLRSLIRGTPRGRI